MKKLALACLLLQVQVFLLVCCTKQGKLFRHGRRKGGNLGAPGDYNEDSVPQAQWFEQKVDHSTYSNLKTWKQRYYINDSFYDYKNPGPVFLMIGGEGPADARWMIKGAWIEYAQRFKALCINLEHRFYGKSFPTSDLSVKNLQYLSSYQALADLANFIGSMNLKHGLTGAKWIAFGGSYPGSLAAWLRLKYPHLVYAAVSSSGPLLAKVDFKEYFQVVINALNEKTNAEDCVNQVKLAHQQIVHIIKTDPSEIEKHFSVCKPFSTASPKDMQNFFSSIADDFAGVVQYNEDNRFSVKPKYKNVTINTVCDILTKPGPTPAYKKLAKFNSIILEQSNQTCMDYGYDAEIQELRNITLTPEGTRQWMYQTCTEFGFYQTSSGATDVFGDYFDLDFYTKQCQDIFGQKFAKEFINRAVAWTNDDYGALNVSVSRVVFVHGSVDPWHALGITKSLNDDTPAIFIKGTAHCANMYPSSEADLPALKAARVQIQQLLAKWISA